MCGCRKRVRFDRLLSGLAGFEGVLPKAAADPARHNGFAEIRDTAAT